jgi:hypothetical protein
VVDARLSDGPGIGSGSDDGIQPILVSQRIFHGILLARNWRENG